MRKELKDFDWHVYGLSTSDFDYIIRVFDDLIKLSRNALDEKLGEINEKEEGYEEIYSDLSYYNDIDNQHLWSFALWRIQSIFEGILKQRYFPNQSLYGIKQKIKKSKEMGFCLSNENEEEIYLWAELRNALSHNPPEIFRPINLNRQDLLEFIELLRNVLNENKI